MTRGDIGLCGLAQLPIEQEGPPSYNGNSDLNSLSGEDENGITDGGWRDPWRDYGSVPDHVVVFSNGSPDAPIHLGTLSKGLGAQSVGGQVFAPTWRTGDLAFTAPIVRDSNMSYWELTVSGEGLVLTTHSISRTVTCVSSLFFSSWYSVRRCDWASRGAAARGVIARFLEYVSEGKVNLSSTGEPEEGCISFDCPLPAPGSGSIPGTRRLRFPHIDCWTGGVSSLRGTIGPIILVRDILVPEGVENVGMIGIDSDPGCYRLDFPRGPKLQKEFRWFVSELSIPQEYDLQVPVYAHTADLTDRTRAGIFIDTRTISMSKTSEKKKFLLVGRDEGLAYVQSAPEGATRGSNITPRECGVRQTPLRVPPLRVVEEVGSFLRKSLAGRCTSVSEIAEHCWVTQRAVIEALADESSDPCIHKTTGCTFGIYRSNTRGGSIRIADMRYSEIKGVLVQFSPEKGLTGALSGEGIAIHEGHLYKLRGAEISYVEPEPDLRIGTEAPVLVPEPRGD